jgi:hypothetical protein
VICENRVLFRLAYAYVLIHGKSRRNLTAKFCSRNTIFERSLRWPVTFQNDYILKETSARGKRLSCRSYLCCQSWHHARSASYHSHTLRSIQPRCTMTKFPLHTQLCSAYRRGLPNLQRWLLLYIGSLGGGGARRRVDEDILYSL